jgi:hypothetical protein
LLVDIGLWGARPIGWIRGGDDDFGISENEIVRAAGVHRRALS